MTDGTAFKEINHAKARMEHIYDRPDPRAYFQDLKNVGYNIPSAAKPIFQKLIGCLRESADDTVCVLDVGCSYGINAALLKHNLSLDDLYDRWGKHRRESATSEEIIQQDRDYFSGLDEVERIEVIGLDVAKNAVAFADEAGLLDEGITVDLENASLPRSAADKLAPVNLVTSTGCVGYVTERSFDQLLPAITKGQRPWFANFVLRMFPFGAIEETLSKAGFTTEKLKGHTFVQREFASAEEQEQVLAQLQDRGIDTTGKEAEGYLLAEFFLSRPTEEANQIPIDRLMFA